MSHRLSHGHVGGGSLGRSVQPVTTHRRKIDLKALPISRHESFPSWGLLRQGLAALAGFGSRAAAPCGWVRAWAVVATVGTLAAGRQARRRRGSAGPREQLAVYQLHLNCGCLVVRKNRKGSRGPALAFVSCAELLGSSFLSSTHPLLLR